MWFLVLSWFGILTSSHDNWLEYLVLWHFPTCWSIEVCWWYSPFCLILKVVSSGKKVFHGPMLAVYLGHPIKNGNDDSQRPMRPCCEPVGKGSATTCRKLDALMMLAANTWFWRIHQIRTWQRVNQNQTSSFESLDLKASPIKLVSQLSIDEHLLPSLLDSTAVRVQQSTSLQLNEGVRRRLAQRVSHALTASKTR